MNPVHQLLQCAEVRVQTPSESRAFLNDRQWRRPWLSPRRQAFVCAALVLPSSRQIQQWRARLQYPEAMEVVKNHCPRCDSPRITVLVRRERCSMWLRARRDAIAQCADCGFTYNLQANVKKWAFASNR